MGMSHGHQLVLGLTPFEEPNAHLAVALARAGARAVLDLGRDAGRARAALADVARWWNGELGVRVPAGCPLLPSDLPASVTLVVLPAGSPWSPASVAAEGADRQVLAEVVSAAEARAAVAAGGARPDRQGLRGRRPRRVDHATFVLLQQLLADGSVTRCRCGRPAASARTPPPRPSPAAPPGVVLDAQLALVTEADLPRDVAAAIRSMDGTETAVVGGHRVYVRPDLPRPATPRASSTRLGGPEPVRAARRRGRRAGAARSPSVTAAPAASIAAVREAVTGQLRTAAALAPTHAPRIAQGPMTRVSDQAAFAAAVAADGGLPFIALALMSGDDARALLEETAELLGDAPWGVGILGFVPAEVRDAQLAAVHDVHPPYALIAGGRPAQAAPLEAAGITTFLHVPSPGLLDRFLAEGARRFVFEGSRVRRPRRSARELPALGHPDPAPAGLRRAATTAPPSSTSSSRAASTTSAPRRWWPRRPRPWSPPAARPACSWAPRTCSPPRPSPPGRSRRRSSARP